MVMGEQVEDGRPRDLDQELLPHGAEEALDLAPAARLGVHQAAAEHGADTSAAFSCDDRATRVWS